MPAQAFAAGAVRGFLHRPDTPSGDGLVLTHGAGSNCEAPLLVAVAEELAAAGITTLRIDLPYRQARPHGPPLPGNAARDREGIAAAASELRQLCAGRVLLGGHSYGGRQATMLAAADPALAGALLLLSYPLHPPRRPTELRTAHFTDLRTPAVFMHGKRDPFGSIEEMEGALKLIPARTNLVVVAGGHELGRGKQALADIAARAVDALLALVA